MQKLIDSYLAFLKEKFTFKKIGDWFEVTTPFLNRFNDCIQIYVKNEGDQNILMCDDGETLKNLELSGVDINSERRKKELAIILNGFGVKLENGMLAVKATKTNFPIKKHSLIQAILAVDDLFVLAQSKITSFFLEDVKNYLTVHDIRYSPDIILTGKSTFQHKFDLLIPASKQESERIIKVVNTPKKQNIIPHLFAFEDTLEIRKNSGIVILNDTEQKVKSEISDALSEYGIFEFPWSKRDKLVEKLAA